MNLNSSAVILSGLLSIATSAVADQSRETDERFAVFQAASIALDRDLPEAMARDGYLLRRDGRVAETAIDLPIVTDQDDARAILATVEVMPQLIEADGGFRPGDPWPRIGSVSVLTPGDGDMIEVELMRFITGFGGTATYTQDVTALAPLLQGRTTFRVSINTYANPAWDVSLHLIFSEDAGYRRPILALPVFNEPHVTSETNVLRATVTIPDNLQRPRVRILSTGHATDGRGGDEFVPRTHILRVDGQEIARWRPWAEQGHGLRHLNPASGRAEIDGRMLWSSDFDRSGWHPGLVVEPWTMPVSELTPGEHEIELEILAIRPPDPEDQQQERGYWRVSMIILADEPWPDRPGVRRGAREGE